MKGRMKAAKAKRPRNEWFQARSKVIEIRHSLFKSLGAAIFMLLLACGSTQGKAPAPHAAEQTRSARADDIHATGMSSDVLTNARVEDNLRSIMVEIPQGEKAHRISFAEIAYPANADENRAMAGFTLLFVTALAHDPNELPLERVFFRDQKGDFDIPPIAERVGRVEPADLRTAFGATRSDGLYAIPLQMTRMTGQLMADFRQGKKDFELMFFPSTELPEGVEPIPPGTPNGAALDAFARREFPVILERGL
jgi:hypothetical protein